MYWLNLYIYIYNIYMCRTVAWGTAFLQKTGWFGVHLKTGSGTTRFRTIQKRHFRGKMWSQQKDQKSQIAPPWAKRSVLQKHTPEFVHGTVGREASSTGCCPYKNKAFWGSRCAKVVRMYEFENICVRKNAFFLHFAKICVLSSGMPVFVV